MGRLLDRIRGKKYDNHKMKRSEVKIKRLQIRWNCFDDKEERYKTVKSNDGGEYRYTEVNHSVHKCRLEKLRRELLTYTLTRMVVTCFRKMNLIVSAVFAMNQALTLMKIMIFETTLKIKVYSFLRQCLC